MGGGFASLKYTHTFVFLPPYQRFSEEMLEVLIIRPEALAYMRPTVAIQVWPPWINFLFLIYMLYDLFCPVFCQKYIKRLLLIIKQLKTLYTFLKSEPWKFSIT